MTATEKTAARLARRAANLQRMRDRIAANLDPVTGEPRRVVVVLTAAEAHWLAWMAGDLAADADELRARLGRRDAGTCFRALAKLREAAGPFPWKTIDRKKGRP